MIASTPVVSFGAGGLGVTLLQVACAIGCYVIARQKGRSQWWALAGFFLGVIGLIIVAFLPDLREDNRDVDLKGEVEDLRWKLRESEFARATVAAPEPGAGICFRCVHFSSRHKVCAIFERTIHENLVECRRFEEASSQVGAP